MFTCPHCRASLRRVEGAHGVSWWCPRCGGRAVGLGLLNRTPAQDYVARVWIAARLAAAPGGRPCPVCEGAMVTVPSLPDYHAPTLDVCRRCQMLWFDPSEFEQVPSVSLVRPPAPSITLPSAPGSTVPDVADAPAGPVVGAAGASSAMAAGLPPEAVEALAIQRAAAEAARIRGSAPAAGPDAWWQWIPGLLGLPVEVASPVATAPLATRTLAALIAAVSVIAFTDLPKAVELLALIPARADRLFGLTVLTSFFLHGGIMHLAGNLYYLILFGDNVEDYLGHRRFLGLIGLAAVAGAIAHIALDPRSDIPVIGASGGISGVVAFYGLTFPRARMAFLIWLRWVRVPAYGFLAFWLLLQAITAWQQISGLTSVSALAHLGGAAVGVWFWLIWRGRSPKRV